MIVDNDILTPKALKLFERLARMEALAGFTLIGGTALALQIGHRKSLDFDFAQFDEQLNRHAINRVIVQLKSEGLPVQLITDPGQLNTHRINTGTDLLNYAQDYVIDGIKLTFFAHDKSAAQRTFYQQAKKTPVQPDGFSVLGLDGLKVAKTLVLDDRVRSRDLFDLYYLTKYHDWSIEEISRCIRTLGLNDDPEAYFEKMVGNYPIDQQDEGLAPVDVNIALDNIYAYFAQQLQAYQVALSQRAWEK